MKKLIALLTVALGLVLASSAFAATTGTSHGSRTAAARKTHATCTKVSRRRHRKAPRCVARKHRARIALVPRSRNHRPKATIARTPTGAPTGSSAPMPGPNPALASSCDLYASPSGSDGTGNGSIGAPFATLRKLDAALAPGQTGCLRAGTYGDTSTWQELATSGTASGQITISSYPGETATVVGWVDIEASYTTLENMRIDGSNTLYPQHPAGVNCADHVSQPLTVNGHNDTLQYLDYFQSVVALRGNAIGVGFAGGSDNTVIRYDKIHDVGGCDFYDHLIYLASSANSQIYDNWMWNDAHGWGIKLDPGPQNARIWGNVIDRAGSGFNFGNSSGSSPTAGNHVFDNIVVNSVGVSNPDIHWSHPGVLVTSAGLMGASTGNQLYNNDYYGNAGGISELAGVNRSQLSLRDNTNTAPQFVDAATHDYALVSGSLPTMSGLARQ